MTKKQGDDGRVVEMDAIDESEWEKDARTPIVEHDQLSKLVQASEKPAAPATVKRTANTVPSQSAKANPTPIPASGPATVRKDATPPASGPAKPGANTLPAAKRPIRPAALPPSVAGGALPSDKSGATASAGTKPADASAPIGKPSANASSSLAKPSANASSSLAKPSANASSSIGKPLANASSSLARPASDASGLAKPATDASAKPATGAATPSSDASTKPATGAATPSSDASSPGIATHDASTGANDASSSGVKAVPDSPAARRALPLPPPRPGRTGAPPTPPARSLPTPRGGSFAFAATTPVEPPKTAPPDKPTEAQIGETSFERDEDLAIPRAAAPGASEPAVIAPPITATRESLERLQPPSPDTEATVVSSPIAAGEPNPFDDQVWRAEGGSDSSADVELAGAHPILGGNPLRESISGFVRNKRNLAIAAGGVVVLIVLIVMATGGDKKPSSAKHASSKRAAKTEVAAKPAGETPSEAPPVETPPVETPPVEAPPAETPTEQAAAETPPAETPPAETPPAETPRHPVTTEHAADTRKKSGSTLAGKQVVLEYDTQAREAKPVPNAAKDDQAAIGKARTSYAAGNTRLFSGDADGAIKNYKQALAYYPAYVAAYRGLGLAYAQKGDKPNALKALRTYVGTVPGAKDAPLIRKRIQSLK